MSEPKKCKCKRIQMPRRSKRMNGRYADHKRMVHEFTLMDIKTTHKHAVYEEYI